MAREEIIEMRICISHVKDFYTSFVLFYTLIIKLMIFYLP